MNKQYNKTDVNSWLNKAKDDLKWANASLKGGFNSQTCFVAQQVAEKSLKAFFYALQKDFNDSDIKALRTHNLKSLINFIENKNFIVPKNIQDSCLILNRYYLPARYPDVPEIPGMASRETANVAIKIAEKIVKFVEDKLS